MPWLAVTRSVANAADGPAPDQSPPGSTAADRKPRLLFIALSLDVGGAERHLSSLLPELSRRGWPVSIYCMNRLGAFAAEVSKAGVEVIGPPLERRAGIQSTPVRLLATAGAGGRLISVIRRVRPRIAHFFLPEPYLIGAPMALMLRVPHCVMSRRGLNLYQRNWPGAASIERRLHPRMSAVLANSRRVAAELEAEGCAPERIGLIYNGVAVQGLGNPVDRIAIRRSLDVAPDALVGIVVANLIDYKGHADLLDALALVRDRLPTGMRLLCIGRDDGARTRLEAMASAYGLGQMVSFLGLREDVPELLGASDLSILPSHEEGFSNAVIEAMAAGLPLVVTDVGGNAEAVVHGTTGLVVPPRRPAALGEAVARLASDAELRRTFGRAGRQRADEHFSLVASVDRYETLYQGILAGRMAGQLPLD